MTQQQTVEQLAYSDIRFQPSDMLALTAAIGKTETESDDIFSGNTFRFNVYNGKFIGTLKIFVYDSGEINWQFIECKGTGNDQEIRSESLPLAATYNVTSDNLMPVLKTVMQLVHRTHGANISSLVWHKGFDEVKPFPVSEQVEKMIKAINQRKEKANNSK